MNEDVQKELEVMIAQESLAVTRCLVAAERAVEEGQFACAKVLRASAHASRRRALQLQRLRAERTAAEAVHDEQRRRTNQPDLPAFTEVDRSLQDILSRAVASLERHRDIVDPDVALCLQGCPDCGWIVEDKAPELCPHCGALGAEFIVFAPFYVATPDRLGRRRPEEILAILEQSSSALASVLDGLDEATLRHNPSANEWSMKEIAGHLIDITELFAGRLNGSTTNPTNLPPWRILETKDYPNVEIGSLITEFTQRTNEVLTYLRAFTTEDWTRPGDRGAPRGHLLDTGTWLANHNLSHLKQLEILRASLRP